MVKSSFRLFISFSSFIFLSVLISYPVKGSEDVFSSDPEPDNEIIIYEELEDDDEEEFIDEDYIEDDEEVFEEEFEEDIETYDFEEVSEEEFEEIEEENESENDMEIIEDTEKSNDLRPFELEYYVICLFIISVGVGCLMGSCLFGWFK